MSEQKKYSYDAKEFHISDLAALECRALASLATQVNSLIVAGHDTEEVKRHLEASGVQMPQELLDLAMSIDVGASHE